MYVPPEEPSHPNVVTACVAPETMDGNGCSSPFVLGGDVPSVGAGSTAASTNQFGIPEGHCGDWSTKGFASNDQVWVWTAPFGGQFEAVLDASFQGVLYVTHSCLLLPSSCIALSDDRSQERVVFSLNAGQLVYLVVDGASNSQNQSGTYTLRVQSVEE